MCKKCNDKYGDVKNSDVHYLLKEIFDNQEIKKIKLICIFFCQKIFKNYIDIIN